jgi:hypothetical protein
MRKIVSTNQDSSNNWPEHSYNTRTNKIKQRTHNKINEGFHIETKKVIFFQVVKTELVYVLIPIGPAQLFLIESL